MNIKNSTDSLHYKTTGDLKFPALIFLHGFMGNSADWDEIIQSLSKKYFCIAIDLPGHGESVDRKALENLWSFAELSRHLDDLFTHLKILRFSLVGYSMGGRIAMHYALQYPQRIKHLAIESSSPGLETEAERKTRLAEDNKLAEHLEKIPFAKFLEAWYSLPVFRGIKDHPDFPDLMKTRGKNNPELLRKSLLSFSTGNQPFLLERLKSIPFPLALFCGERDKKYVGVMQSIKKNFAGAHLFILKNCSHNTHFENPDQFANNLTEFLSL